MADFACKECGYLFSAKMTADGHISYRIGGEELRPGEPVPPDYLAICQRVRDMKALCQCMVATVGDAIQAGTF